MSSNSNVETVTSEPEIVDSVPLIPFKVIDTEIPFFRDSQCQERVEGAWIAILLALDPEDQIIEQELVPTTKKYNKGDYVTMNLESKKLWEESWYKNPNTGRVEKAWEIHVAFVGHRISESALEKDRERIAELERLMDERMNSSANVR